MEEKPLTKESINVLFGSKFDYLLKLSCRNGVPEDCDLRDELPKIESQIVDLLDCKDRMKKFVSYLHELYLDKKLDTINATFLTVILREWVMLGKSDVLGPSLSMKLK